jgi:iron complex transport system permease protein
MSARTIIALLIGGVLIMGALGTLFGGSGFLFPMDGGTFPQDRARVLFLEIRMPRVVVAFLVGSALGGAGAALQGLFRNPLADPAILGVSGFAALAAQVAIFLGLGHRFPWSLPLLATAGALVATFSLLRLVGSSQRGALELLILGGVALGQIAAALSALTTSLALRDFTVAQRLLAWMLGSLEGRTWMHVYWGLGPVVASLIWLSLRARALDALTLGEATAHSLGVSVEGVRREVVWACAVLSGISVAIGGIVGFVGLIAPHVVRSLGLRTHGPLLIGSSLLGGLLVLSADLLCRMIIAPAELQIGVVTAAFGAPWFALILRRRLSEALG